MHDNLMVITLIMVFSQPEKKEHCLPPTVGTMGVGGKGNWVQILALALAACEDMGK